MAMEIEAKLRVADHAPLRARLKALGARAGGTVREHNRVLDDPAGSLRRDGKLLRVRSTGGPDCVLTVKAPVAMPGGAANDFKTREEVELVAGPAETLLRQFELLGYRTAWIYEKIRETWSYGGCEIALDTLPELGCFIEIEGAPAAIRSVLVDLGLDPGAHIDDNYLGLWRTHLAARGEAQRDMVFA